MTSLSPRMEQIANSFYEKMCRYEIGVILDGWLNGPVLADRDLLNAKLLQARRDGHISRDELLDGTRLDIIAREVEDTDHTGPLAAVQALVTINKNDLETAARRAAIIAKITGATTAPFIATHSNWPDEINEAARQLGVTIIRHEDPDFVDPN